MICVGFSCPKESIQEEIRIRVEGIIDTKEMFKRETDFGMLYGLFGEPEWRWKSRLDLREKEKEK
jgi:hypothetical protein